nr:PREDICTED: uncharacterized protein LOC106490223 [Apteryx mantelli mantelli]
MGGIFSKNRRLRVFPKKVALYKAKGKKTRGTACTSHDASTWTGENHFHSARIGRTPKALEASVEELASDTTEGESAAQAKWDRGKQAASLHAQQAEAPFTVTAEDAQDVEVPQEPEAEPDTEVMQCQEPVEQTTQEPHSAREALQETGKTAAAVHPAGGCMPDTQVSQEDHEVLTVTQTTVRVEVHVSAEVQGGPCEVQPATGIPLESGMLTLAEKEATVKCVSEDLCVGKPHEDVPVQKAAESPAAPHTTAESELPLKTPEAREGIMDLPNSAEGQTVEERASCAATAPPDPQTERDTEVPTTENMEENSLEPEQAEEMTELSEGQISKEIPCCLTGTQPALHEEEEEIKAGTQGKPACSGDCNRALKEHEIGCSKHPAD